MKHTLCGYKESHKRNHIVYVKRDIVENMILYKDVFCDIFSNNLSGNYTRKHAYTNSCDAGIHKP